MSDEYPADETPPPAAIGLLAQGIDHDLSNLLTAIGATPGFCWTRSSPVMPGARTPSRSAGRPTVPHC